MQKQGFYGQDALLAAQHGNQQHQSTDKYYNNK